MNSCFFAIAAWCCLHAAPAAALAVNGSFIGIAHVTLQGAERPGGAEMPGPIILALSRWPEHRCSPCPS